jgi:hypothetical protein
MEASAKLTLIAKNVEFLTFSYKFLLLIEILKSKVAHRKNKLYGWNVHKKLYMEH